jgi:hypothetical protein
MRRRIRLGLVLESGLFMGDETGRAGSDGGYAAGTNWNGARALALYRAQQKMMRGHEG